MAREPSPGEPVVEYGDFPAGSPVTELGRWMQDSTTDGRHEVQIRHDFDHGWTVTFEYPYMEISLRPDILQVREDGGVRELDRGTPELAGKKLMDSGIGGTVSEIEFVEAINTVLTLAGFEEE